MHDNTPPNRLGNITPVDDQATLQNLQLEINHLNAQYARALDEKDFEQWPEFFIHEGRYTVRSRENHERGLPLALMDLESQGMMKDRIYGVTNTIFHAPYYTRHVVSCTLIVGSTPTSSLSPPVQSTTLGPTLWVSSTSYAVFRTKPTQATEVFNVGQYLDHWTSTPTGLKLVSRLCVYDSEMVLNSFIYPI